MRSPYVKACKHVVRGTVGYQAPEVIERQTRIDVAVNGTADQESLGVTLFMLCRGGVPEFNEGGVINAPDWLPLPLMDVIRDVMDKYPPKRRPLDSCRRQLQPFWDRYSKNLINPKT